jgi:hypothetical protein
MKMIRTFHPVGQGAFYSECFEDDIAKRHILYGFKLMLDGCLNFQEPCSLDN